MDIKATLDKFRKGFTAILVGSILAVLVGSVMLIVAYVVLSSVLTSIGTVSNAALNTSMFGNIANITSALNIVGISLIVELSSFCALIGKRGFLMRIWDIGDPIYAHKPWRNWWTQIILPPFAKCDAIRPPFMVGG